MIQNAECSELDGFNMQGSLSLFGIWFGGVGFTCFFPVHYYQIAQLPLNSLLYLGCCGFICPLKT